MKVLTYTSYKEHCDLHAEVHGSIAVNSCQIKLSEKDIILLSNPPIITYKAGTTHGVENRNLIHSSIPAGTYSIDDHNTRIKEFVLKQRQDWKPPQVKDLKLVIPRDYTFWADNAIIIALGIQDKYLKKVNRVRSVLPPGSYKTSLDLLPRSLSLHCKQINKVKNELDGQPSSLLAPMHVSNYKVTFSPVHLVFLELGTDRPHLDFKILGENNNEVIPKTFKKYPTIK